MTVCTPDRDNYSAPAESSWGNLGNFPSGEGGLSGSGVRQAPSGSLAPSMEFNEPKWNSSAKIPTPSFHNPVAPSLTISPMQMPNFADIDPSVMPWAQIQSLQRDAAAAGAFVAILTNLQRVAQKIAADNLNAVLNSNVEVQGEFSRLGSLNTEELKDEVAKTARKLIDIRKNDRVLGQDGLLKIELVPNVELQQIRKSLSLKSSGRQQEGRDVRRVLNRIFAKVPTNAPQKMIEGAQMSASLAVAADEAAIRGDSTIASALIKSSLTAFDLALGFIPLASSANDASQILYGMITGADYTGRKMTSGDYALRGAGIVYGLLPQTNLFFRFGEFAVGRDILTVAQDFRSMSLEAFDQLTKSVLPILTNEFGAVGSGLSALIKYQKLFGADSERLVHMMSGLKPFNEIFLKVGREITKHPGIAGFESDVAMRAMHPSSAALNVLGENELAQILKNGTVEKAYSKTRQEFVLDYRLPSGFGARFEIETKKMIGFLNPPGDHLGTR